MPYYEPVTDAATGAADVKTFWAGIGYWTGGTGALAASYQWQRNGANIAGATARSYTRTTADSGRQLRCVVTVGGLQAASNAVSIPAAGTFPSTTLIDTEFGGRFPYDWPTVWANMQAAASNAEILHLEEVKLSGGSTRGLVRARKTGGTPGISNAVIASSVAAGTYSWEAEVACGQFPTSDAETIQGPLRFRLRNAANADIAAITVEAADLPGIVSGRGSFVLGAGETVKLYLAVATGVGGIAGAGGGPVITRLKIWRP
jgi:hypothetical protein